MLLVTAMRCISPNKISVTRSALTLNTDVNSSQGSHNITAVVCQMELIPNLAFKVGESQRNGLLVLPQDRLEVINAGVRM
jgi:hypothetical protein